MFCPKCGTQAIEGSAFCQKCGECLIIDGTTPQAPFTQTSEPITITTAAAPEKPGGGLRNVAKIGRVLFGISMLLLFLSAVFGLSINPIITIVGVAAGIILSALGLKRPFGISKIIELAVAGVLLVVVIVYAVSSGGGIGGDKYVQMVKDGTLGGYPQKTVGEAFDDFLDNPKWESGVTDGDVRFVNVMGGILYLDEEADLAVQFLVNEDDGSFTYNACEMDGAPQNDLFFWNLLETVYNSDSMAAVPQNTSGGDRIEIGETQILDGKLEVTLDYIEFVEQIGTIYPEDGNIFLRATMTVKNLGTESGGVSSMLSTVTYDNSYDFSAYILGDEGDISSLNPLTEASTGSMVFEVSRVVAETDKALVLHISENLIGGDIMSFVVRPGVGGASGQGASSGSGSGEVVFNGIPLSQFFEMSADEAVAALGNGATHDAFKIYGGIEFNLDGDKITSGESMNPGDFTIDGVTLDKNRAELIALLGDPLEEGEGGSGYEMTFERTGYNLTIATGDMDSPAWRVFISPTNQPNGSSAGNSMPTSFDGTQESAKALLEAWLVDNPIITGADYALEAQEMETIDGANYHRFLVLVNGAPLQAGNFAVSEGTGELYMLLAFVVGDGYEYSTQPLDMWYEYEIG